MPKGELPPKGEVEDPELNEEPLFPNVDPEEPTEEVEAPKGEEEEDPGDPVDATPVEAPVGVMPVCGADWPKKPVPTTGVFSP